MNPEIYEEVYIDGSGISMGIVTCYYTDLGWILKDTNSERAISVYNELLAKYRVKNKHE